MFVGRMSKKREESRQAHVLCLWYLGRMEAPGSGAGGADESSTGPKGHQGCTKTWGSLGLKRVSE